MSTNTTLSSKNRPYTLLAALLAAGASATALAATDDPSGACCYDDPDAGGLVCVNVTPNQCADLGGYFYGVGTACDTCPGV